MKKWILLLAAFTSGAALADWQNGYVRKDGTYVQGHTKSEPDSNRYNNYGSQSNGGRQRDEFSPDGGATNKSNSSWGFRDNDRDGVPNAYDSKPNSKHR